MVIKNIPWLVMTLALCARLHAAVVIRSIDILSDSVLAIKPCQPASVALAVVVDGLYGQDDSDDVAAELSREVMVNDRVFVSRFRGVNQAAFFEIDRSSIKPKPNGTTQINAVVLFQWNLADEEFLFEHPGQYQIKLVAGTQIRVDVLDPTAVEREIIKEIKQMGMEFSLGFTNPGDIQRTVSLLPRLNRILEKWPDTAYTPLIAPYVGLGKLNQLAGHIADGDNADLGEYLAQRVDIGKRYIVPYMTSIHSPIDATAAFVAANDFVDQARRKGQRTPEAVESQTQAKELLTKIAKSPFAGHLRESVSKRLEKLSD